MLNVEGKVKILPTSDDGQGSVVYDTGIDATLSD